MAIPSEIQAMITAAARQTQHVVRPEGLWVCVVDGELWPCAVARDDMLVAYADEPTAMRVYLDVQLDHACQRMPEIPPAELFQLVVGWAPRRLGMVG